MDSGSAVESVVRDSYGRLIAFLSSRTRDVAGAEDALSDALLSALQRWPKDGVPANPESWLVAVARRKLIDRNRHRKVAIAHALEQYEREASLRYVSNDQLVVADERLLLLFVCAHPAIDPAVHTPLMLQTVLGFSAERIAAAFMVSASAMSQRLVRAKAKILKAGIAFKIPEQTCFPERLDAVLEAIYAAFGSGWESASQPGLDRDDLAEDAIWLARLLVDLLPEAPEARGLLALMLYCQSRREARRRDGDFVALSDQDTGLWSIPLIREASQQLTAAAKYLQPGRFQLEAAIQSAHLERAKTGRTNWDAITGLYDRLVEISPTIGAKVARAAAAAESDHPAAAMGLLDQLPESEIRNYQPYWAVRAHLLQRLNQNQESIAHFEKAIALTKDDAVRRHLVGRMPPG
ncbi:MAG: RNA polymerase subunit sigma-24 [Pirellulales bacterium]|nr:RNA polymerase subunit sigma-24 [Pirellulales bacterium]